MRRWHSEKSKHRDIRQPRRLWVEAVAVVVAHQKLVKTEMHPIIVINAVCAERRNAGTRRADNSINCASYSIFKCRRILHILVIKVRHSCSARSTQHRCVSGTDPFAYSSYRLLPVRCALHNVCKLRRKKHSIFITL